MVSCRPGTMWMSLAPRSRDWRICSSTRRAVACSLAASISSRSSRLLSSSARSSVERASDSSKAFFSSALISPLRKASTCSWYDSISSSSVLRCQRFAQQPHGLRHPRLHGADRDLQPCGDLAVAQPLKMAQREHVPVVRRQPGDSPADLLVTVSLQQNRLRLRDRKGALPGLLNRGDTNLGPELLALVQPVVLA